MNTSQLDISPADVIGEGEFGTVFKAFYCGIRVAVKKLNIPENATQYQLEDFKYEMEREIDILKNLRHPNIVSMISSNHEFIVMELYDGDASDIKSYLEMAIVSRDCMGALMYMQANDECVMHGDIKPQNILVKRGHNGRIVKAALGDIGLSRVCNIYTNWQGTPGYMPEPNPYVNPTHDIFALIVSVLDGYFHERVSSAFEGEFKNNSWEFIASLPKDIIPVASNMHVSYERLEMDENVNLRHKFMRQIIHDWDIVVETYMNKPHEGNDELLRSFTPPEHNIN